MRKSLLKSILAQSAVEYMLLLGVVAAIVLIGMKTLLPRTHNASEEYFNTVAIGIMGKQNPCGDGVIGPSETINNCCVDLGACVSN